MNCRERVLHLERLGERCPIGNRENGGRCRNARLASGVCGTHERSMYVAFLEGASLADLALTWSISAAIVEAALRRRAAPGIAR